MTGQFDKDTAVRLIDKHFGQMMPRNPGRRLPPFGNFSHSGLKTFYHHEKESGATSVSIETIVQKEAPPDSKAYRHLEMLADLSNRMVQKRLDILLQKPDSIMTNAAVDAGDFLQQVRYTAISADCRPENWSQALALIEQTLRKTLAHGFTPSELARAKADYRALLQRALNEEKTRDSKELAQDMMHSLNQWHVYQSPRQRMTLLIPMLDSIDIDQVNKAFADMWSVPHRLVLVTGNADLTVQHGIPEDEIRSVYLASQAVPVTAPADKAAARFPYLDLPARAGEIVRREKIADLGIERVIFANGFHLILKKTAFKEKEVLAALSFGGGAASEPADQPGLAELAEAVVNESGFGAMDRIDLENALSGRLADIDFRVDEDMFVLKGKAANSELPLLFQLMYAFINDPAYRRDNLDLALKRLEQDYESYAHSVEGQMKLHGDRFLAGGDNRFGLPAWQQIQSLTIEKIKRWLGGQLSGAPLELAVVGDFQTDELIALATRYMGSLPDRAAAEQPAPRAQKPRFPENDRLELAVDTVIGKGLVLVAYPTADFWNIQRTRRLNILAEILSERLRVGIREKTGAVYSPFAYHHPYRAYPGYGLLKTYLLVDPAQAAQMAAEVKNITTELAARGITQDELQRALDPALARIKDLRQENTYWLNSVMLGAYRHPEQLDWARVMEKDYAAIHLGDINSLAKQYLDNRKAAEMIVVPESSVER